MKSRDHRINTNAFVRIICLALAVLLSASIFAACKHKEEEQPKEYDPDYVVASIGNQQITYALYKAAFISYAEYFRQMGFDPLAESEIESFRNLVVDALVNDMLTLHHAEEEGFTLSDAVREDTLKQAEEELASIRADYTALAEEAVAQDPSLDFDTEFATLVADMSEYYTGKRMTFDEYSEEYTKETMNSAIVVEYKDFVCSQFNVTEADISSWYSVQVESDEELYTEHPEQYKKDQENFELNGESNLEAYPAAWVPEGYSRIRCISVRPSGEISDEYKEKLTRLSAVGEECAALLFTDALNGNDDNRERIDELLSEYRNLEAETQAMFDEYAREAREKIDAAYRELEDGADFGEVILRYSKDADVTGGENGEPCQSFVERGKLISLTHTSSTDWSQTVKDIYSMTEKGCYSSVFSDEDGTLRIIYHGEDEPSGAVPLDQIKEAVKRIVRAEKADSDWDELLDAWKDDPNLKIDMEAIKTVTGKELDSGENVPR